MNQYDRVAAAALLESLGFRLADDDQPVDCTVVQTCCVTTTAMRKCRQAIRRAHRRSPRAALCVVGCYSTYHARGIEELCDRMNLPPERRLIVGHHDDIAAQLRLFIEHAFGENDSPGLDNDFTAPQGVAPASIATPETLVRRRNRAVGKTHAGAQGLPTIGRFAGHQRAFVKIQDGCDAFCSYCVVPYLRANVVSRSEGDILDECRRLIAAGHREIVLCGVFLGAFGRATALRRHWDSSPSRLAELLRRVAGLEGLWRVRLSSLEPGDLTDQLLTVIAETPTVAPHLHLPLQSGSTAVLKRMNRQYTPEEFLEASVRLRSALDRPALTTDVIAGFPRETDADFQATLDVLREAGVMKIHAFPFSPVEPTVAWRDRHNRPSEPIVQQRMASLAELETELATAYRRRFVGETLEGVVESTRPAPNQSQAMTDRYLTTVFPASDEPLTGRIVRLNITSTTDTGLSGTPIAARLYETR